MKTFQGKPRQRIKHASLQLHAKNVKAFCYEILLYTKCITVSQITLKYRLKENMNPFTREETFL